MDNRFDGVAEVGVEEAAVTAAVRGGVSNPVPKGGCFLSRMNCEKQKRDTGGGREG